MARTSHYEVLGLSMTATAADIRSAYRRLVLEHHPDKSNTAESRHLFLKANEAYQVLSDPAKRNNYDRYLESASSTQQTAGEVRSSPPPSEPDPVAREQQAAERKDPYKRTAGATHNASVDVGRLAGLFSRGRFAEAESLARDILRRYPREPLAYAVLGDLARSRGDFDEAQTMYSYAAQMSPNNEVYQRRYEQLLNASSMREGNMRAYLERKSEQPAVLAVVGFIVLMGAGYVALSREGQLWPTFTLVSTWTAGLMVMLFVSGVALGACLSLANIVDRVESATSSATGKLSPTVALGLVAVVNFWACVLLYVGIGLAQRAYNFTTTRMVAGVAGVTLIFSAAGSLSGIFFLQTLLWGGNLVYLGALIGWIVADSFRS